ncbi:MAG TPA: peptidylprolyl isomerase [Aquihabitans sp.]|jgi:cyclophilin family peptidyl-prolyl cis-trans isomerase|nr:peptidylprolyl isomerase [Aquihabitans sp.]
MGTDKRDRQKANKAARLAAQQAAEARARRIKAVRNAVILVIAIIVVGFLLAGCGDDDDASGTGAGSNDDVASSGASYGTTECPPAEGVDEPQIDFEAGFERCIDPEKTYTATVETTEGTVEVELDTERTPVTTNNFVALARYGYYDGTDLFRTEAQSGIIQGGSPHTQDNGDPGPGPSFSVPDEALPFTAEDYGPGTLAMARTAAPNSASGQFFFLANEGGRYLADPSLGASAGSYVAFGTATEGLDVLEAIAALDDGSGTPSKQVTIESVEISES